MFRYVIQTFIVEVNYPIYRPGTYKITEPGTYNLVRKDPLRTPEGIAAGSITALAI